MGWVCSRRVVACKTRHVSQSEPSGDWVKSRKGEGETAKRAHSTESRATSRGHQFGWANGTLLRFLVAV